MCCKITGLGLDLGLHLYIFGGFWWLGLKPGCVSRVGGAGRGCHSPEGGEGLGREGTPGLGQDPLRQVRPPDPGWTPRTRLDPSDPGRGRFPLRAPSGPPQPRPLSALRARIFPPFFPPALFPSHPGWAELGARQSRPFARPSHSHWSVASKYE